MQKAIFGFKILNLVPNCNRIHALYCYICTNFSVSI